MDPLPPGQIYNMSALYVGLASKLCGIFLLAYYYEDITLASLVYVNCLNKITITEQLNLFQLTCNLDV